MLTRRAKAYSSSCSQTALAISSQFTLEMRGAAEDCKKTIKLLIFGVYGLLKSSMLIRRKSSSLVLVVIDSMPMLICNRFHERLANSGKTTTLRGYRSLMPSCAGFLESRWSRLGPLKSTFNAENFMCSLSWSIYSKFEAIRFRNVSRSPNLPKNPYFKVQGYPRVLLSLAIKSPCTTSY